MLSHFAARSLPPAFSRAAAGCRESIVVHLIHQQTALVLCRVPQKEEEAVVIFQQDPRLENALQQSLRVGDMLLKNEQQETAQINRLAAHLLDREYRYNTGALFGLALLPCR